MDKYEIVDQKTWSRKTHCQVFKDYLEPNFCITFNLEITHFLNEIRKSDYSFTLSLIHSITKVMNDIENFKYRFQGSNVILLDQLNTSFTHLDKDDELFKVITAPFLTNLKDYINNTKTVIEKQSEYFTGPLGIDIIQFSPMPWIEYSHISHTISGKGNNSTPMVDWGKYFKKENQVYLPLSIQAHHSFVDGIHVKKFKDNLQKYLDEFTIS